MGVCISFLLPPSLSLVGYLSLHLARALYSCISRTIPATIAGDRATLEERSPLLGISTEFHCRSCVQSSEAATPAYQAHFSKKNIGRMELRIVDQTEKERKNRTAVRFYNSCLHVLGIDVLSVTFIFSGDKTGKTEEEEKYSGNVSLAYFA